MAINRDELNIKSQKELFAKLIEKQENTLKSLSERQHEVLKDLLKQQIKDNDMRDEKGRFMKGRDSRAQAERSRELQALDTLPVMAASISKNLGMEKGTKRIMEDRLTEMAFVNKDVRDALVKGDSGDVKGEMIRILTEQLETMKFDSDEEKARHQVLIEELNNAGENMFDWEKIGNKADNIFFPLTQKFWEVAEGIRGAVQEVPALGRFFTEDMVEHYRQGIEKANEIFGSHVQTILAPIDALVGPIKGIVKGSWQIFKTLASGPSKYEKETAKYTRKTYEQTREQTKIEREKWLDEKKKAAGDIYKKSGAKQIVDMLKKGLLMVVGVIGMAMGGLVGKILLPFKAIASALGAFGGMMKSLPAMQAFAKKIPTFIKWTQGLTGLFSNIITKVTRWFRMSRVFLSKLPMVGKIFRRFFFMFSKGMAKLAWPLQIIMSLIDFVKGFQATEGNIFQRIVGGLEEAVVGFLNLPIRLFGWVVEKILGLFGVEVDGVADEIIGMIRSVFDFYKNSIGKIASFFGFGDDEEESDGKPDGRRRKKQSPWDGDKAWEDGRDRYGFNSDERKRLYGEWQQGLAEGTLSPDFNTFEKYKAWIAHTNSQQKALADLNAENKVPTAQPESTTTVPRAKARAQARAQRATEALGSKMDVANENIAANTESNKTIIQNLAVTDKSEPRDEIPSELLLAGIPFVNND